MRLQCSPLWLVLLACSCLDIHAFRIRKTKLRAVISNSSWRAEKHETKFLALLRDDAHQRTGLPTLTERLNTTGPGGNKLMDAITKMQVETCVHMKKLYSEDFDAFKKCLELLSKLCKPGKDLKMDGDPKERSTGEGFCKGFFGARKRIRDKAKARAQECVEISKKQDNSSDEYNSCLKYMVKLCDPGEDMLMDGDEKENPTGTGVCQEFFHQEKPSAPNGQGDGKKGNGEGGTGDGGGGGGKSNTGSGAGEPKEQSAKSVDGNGTEGQSGKTAGERGNAGSGDGGAEVSGDSVGATGSGQEGVEGGDKGNGTKNGAAGGSKGVVEGTDGKGVARAAGQTASGAGVVAGGEVDGDVNGTLDSGGSGKGSEDADTGPPLPPHHMKEDTGLQEQGFAGPNVEHDDMKTHTSDWRKEYGPNHPNYKEIAEICLEHPDNSWCRRYLPKKEAEEKVYTRGRPQKSSTERVASSAFVMMIMFSLQVR